MQLTGDAEALGLGGRFSPRCHLPRHLAVALPAAANGFADTDQQRQDQGDDEGADDRLRTPDEHVGADWPHDGDPRNGPPGPDARRAHDRADHGEGEGDGRERWAGRQSDRRDAERRHGDDDRPGVRAAEEQQERGRQCDEDSGQRPRVSRGEMRGDEDTGKLHEHRQHHGEPDRPGGPAAAAPAGSPAASLDVARPAAPAGVMPRRAGVGGRVPGHSFMLISPPRPCSAPAGVCRLLPREYAARPRVALGLAAVRGGTVHSGSAPGRGRNR